MVPCRVFNTSAVQHECHHTIRTKNPTHHASSEPVPRSQRTAEIERGQGDVVSEIVGQSLRAHIADLVGYPTKHKTPMCNADATKHRVSWYT